MSIERRLQMVFGALAIVLVATFVLQTINQEGQTRTRQLVQQGRAAIDELAWLRAHVAENDAAVRGYLLSPESRFRVLIEEIQSQIGRHLDALGMLVAGHAGQSSRLVQLREGLRAQHEAGQKLMQLRDDSGLAIASKAIVTGEVMPEAGRLRTILAEMDQQEHIIVENRREQRLRTSGQVWLFTATALVGVVFGLLVTAYLMFRRHRTQREALEKDLRDKNKELQDASRLKSEFLAHMSHELRTPLNAVIGYTGTLLMKLPGPLTADQERQLKTVQSSARHLLSLINDVLDLARIESGRVEIELKLLGCREVMEEVLATLGPLAQAKSISLAAEFPEQPIEVRTDRRAMSQILINLANNAIKFTEKGSVTLRLRQRDGASGNLVAIDILDTGVGVKTEEQARLFRAFQQLQAGKPRSEGTGLGLYLSGRLAELIQCRIEFESEYGKGSRFTLLIPKP